MGDSPEERLSHRVRQGDRAALVEYLELRRPDLLRFIEKNLGDGLKRKADAEDILQEVNCSCLDAFDRIDLSDRDPFSWFCRTAERRIVDTHRRHFATRKRDASREVLLSTPSGADKNSELANLLVSSITSPSMAVSREQQEALLSKALQQLSSDEKQALHFRFVDNLPSKEIASRLGKGDGAVRMLLSRAVKRLEKLMGDSAQ